MRAWVLALALLAISCSKPAPEKQEAAPAPQAAQSDTTADAGVVLAPHDIVGTWSFDQSCASGDGMILSADGTASFDEWGSGTWRIEDGKLVLDLATQEPGVDPDPNAPHQTKTIEASVPVSEHLVGVVSPDGRAINALRCPSAQPGASQ